MTFNDIFKSSFLENVTSVSVLDMFIAIGLSFAIGLLIFFVYKKTYSGVMFSSGFGVTLIALSMITTVVMLAVTSNVVLSLGMVGALSIVRFRTANKEPLDIAFLFWSIAAGIVLAAGMIPLAVIGSAIIAVILLIFVNRKSTSTPYILVLNCNSSVCEENVLKFLKDNTKKYVLKSKSVNDSSAQLNIDVRLKDGDAQFVNSLCGIDGVSNVTLVSYNGDYMG